MEIDRYRVWKVRHKIADEPFCRKHSCREVFKGDNDIKTPENPDYPVLFYESGSGLFESNFRNIEGIDGFFSGKEIETLGLERIHPQAGRSV